MSSLLPDDEDPRAAAAAAQMSYQPQTTVSEAHLMYQKYHRHHQSSTAEAKSHDHKEVPDFAMFHRVSKTGVSKVIAIESLLLLNFLTNLHYSYIGLTDKLK
jgi:hypothetical protein